jgi:hypothetical protein
MFECSLCHKIFQKGTSISVQFNSLTLNHDVEANCCLQSPRTKGTAFIVVQNKQLLNHLGESHAYIASDGNPGAMENTQSAPLARLLVVIANMMEFYLKVLLRQARPRTYRPLKIPREGTISQ